MENPIHCELWQLLSRITRFNQFSIRYASELIRNQTLKFLSKTLPVLKADDTLPKVTQIFADQPVERYVEYAQECNQWLAK